MHGEPLDESGRSDGPDQFILILRDVTARKDAEQQRETSRNMLALGEMAAVLAHEIRNPLGSMELWTNVLDKQREIGEEGKYCVEHLQAGNPLPLGDGQQRFAVSWSRISQSRPVETEDSVAEWNGVHSSSGRAGGSQA